MENKDSSSGELEVFNYTCYTITNIDDGKMYVGVTKRTLQERIKAHIREARKRGVHPDGLPVAIRKAWGEGDYFEDVFEVDTIETFIDTKNYAKERERYWEQKLKTRVPRGYNVMPGGSSVGWVQNAIPVSFNVDGEEKKFKCISDGTNWLNARCDSVDDYLEYVTVAARIRAGWPFPEAFGLEPHIDERMLREPFIFDDEEHYSLRLVSDISGIEYDALKSKLHRAIKLGKPNHDLAVPLPRTNKGKKGSFKLPHPHNSDKDGISQREFEGLTGVPQPTVGSRARRYFEIMPKHERSRSELLRYLRSDNDRSIYVEVTLPNGVYVKKSIRQFAELLISSSALQQYRLNTFGFDSLKKRLEALFKETPSPTKAEIYQAVGLSY